MWQSVASDYNYILAMLLWLSERGRLEFTQFSVSTVSGHASVIRRDELFNRQKWCFLVPKILLRYTGLPSLGLKLKDLAILEV